MTVIDTPGVSYRVLLGISIDTPGVSLYIHLPRGWAKG